METRFSVWLSLANFLARPDHEVYAEVDRRYRAADDLGFDAAFALEHHGSDYVVSPDTMLLNAYAAAITRRIRLANAVVVAPWHNPLRLAEQVTMLDLLSGGRALVGLGRGMNVREHEIMGVDPESTRERFREAVEVMQLALSGEPFDYDGPFHSYRGVTVRPRPAAGTIPIVGAVMSPPSARLFAEMGIGVLMGGPGTPPEFTLDALGEYRAAALRQGMDLARTEMIYNGLTWIADTDEKAFEEILPLAPTFIEGGLRHYNVANNPWKGLKTWEYAAELAERYQSMMGTADAGTIAAWCELNWVGSPETVARRVKTFIDGGFNHIMFQCDLGGTISVAKQIQMWERIIGEVVPLLGRVDPYYDVALPAAAGGALVS